MISFNGTNIGVEENGDYNVGSDNNPKNFYSFTRNSIEYICLSALRNNIGNELCTLRSSPFSTIFTTSTILLKDINPTGSSNPDDFIEYNNVIYFTADDGTNGRELHVTDGLTTASTILFNDINPFWKFKSK